MIAKHNPDDCRSCMRVRSAVRDGDILCTHGSVTGWPPRCGLCTSILPEDTWKAYVRDGRWWAP